MRYRVNVMYCGAEKLASYESALTTLEKAEKSFAQWRAFRGTIEVMIYDTKAGRAAGNWNVYNHGSPKQREQVEAIKRSYQNEQAK